MADLTETAIDGAIERGRVALATEPRALAARYDRRLDRVIDDLANGFTFAFPPRAAQGLGESTPEQLEVVEVLGVGFGLHWEKLDADLQVAGLLAGLFGTRAYAARRAGGATSPAKAAAARANGAKGGRPRKAATVIKQTMASSAHTTRA
jgi:hypothetical protein